MQVVEKVWGREEIIVNEAYCGKRMFLKKGYRCSLHMHLTKDETFFMTKGSMQVLICPGEGPAEVVILRVNETLRIKPKTWHSFTGLDDENEFFEFSTHHDAADTVRRVASGKVDEDPK